MLEQDLVPAGIEPDGVLADDAAGADRRHGEPVLLQRQHAGDLAFGLAAAAHPGLRDVAGQDLRRSRWRILLFPVVFLDDVGVVVREVGDQGRRVLHDLIEKVDAQGKVCGVHEPSAGRGDQLAHLGLVVAPPGRPHHVARAGLQRPPGVRDHRVRLREVDADRAEMGKPGRPGDDHGLVPPLEEGRLHLAAHPAVADDRDPHQWTIRSAAFPAISGTSSAASKNSRCRARTARSASPSATTNETFTSEAPKEIMTTFTSRMAWKIRPARPACRTKPRPITLTMAMPARTFTSPRAASSSSTARRRDGSSTVSEIETSEVAIRSTGVRWRSNTSNTRATNP